MLACSVTNWLAERAKEAILRSTSVELDEDQDWHDQHSFIKLTWQKFNLI